MTTPNDPNDPNGWNRYQAGSGDEPTRNLGTGQPYPQEPYQQQPYTQPYPEQPYQQQPYTQPYGNSQTPGGQPGPQEPYGAGAYQQAGPYGGQGPYGVTPGQPYGPPPQKKTNTPLIVGVAVVAVLILAVGGFFLLRGSDDDTTTASSGTSSTASTTTTGSDGSTTSADSPTTAAGDDRSQVEAVFTAYIKAITRGDMDEAASRVCADIPGARDALRRMGDSLGSLGGSTELAVKIKNVELNGDQASVDAAFDVVGTEIPVPGQLKKSSDGWCVAG